MNQLRRGYLLAGAAYLMWGFFPPYYKLLRRAGPIEVLAHRVLWSLVFVSLLLGVLRRGRRLVGLLRQPRMLAGVTAAAVLIAVNWGMYIYAVMSDHIVEASLGYFINPLLTVLLGVVILRERLRRSQWVALGVGAVAVAVLTADYGRPPWIALTLAASFGMYGLIKKWLALPAAEGLVAESAVLTVPALAYVAVLAHQGRSTFGTVSALHTTLLIVSGVLTAIPLLCFAAATNLIPLSGIGIMQYITPTIQFGFGVLVYREAMPPARAAGFGLVWLALAIFTVDSLRAKTDIPGTPIPADDSDKGRPWEDPKVPNGSEVPNGLAVRGRSAAAGSPSPSAARP